MAKKKKENLPDSEIETSDVEIEESEESGLEKVEIVEDEFESPLSAKAIKLIASKTKQEIIEYAKKYNLNLSEDQLVKGVVHFLVTKKPASVEAGKIW